MNIIKPCLNLFLAYLVSELRGFLSRLVGVPSHRSFLAHVRLTEMLSTGFSLLHLLWCHVLEGLHAVFVHVDGELVHEVLGLYVGSIRLQDVSVRSCEFVKIDLAHMLLGIVGKFIIRFLVMDC